MNIRRTLRGCAWVCGLSTACAWANTAVQVRDAAGGESFGFTPGLYAVPTASVLESSINGEAPVQVFTGTFAFEADYGTGFVPLMTYCLDVEQTVQFQIIEKDTQGLTYKLGPLDSLSALTATEVQQLQLLWANAFDDSMVSDVASAAFQAIIWELIGDDTLDLSSGAFALNVADPFSQDVLQAAQPWVDALVTNSWTQTVPLFVLSHPTSQDLLTTIPEPTTASAIALLGLAVIRRRR